MGNISAQICFFKSTHPFFLKAMPSFSSSSLCSVQLGANLPWLFTTLWQGKFSSLGALNMACPTMREHCGLRASLANCP